MRKLNYRFLLSACALAVGLGISLTAFARPCCCLCAEGSAGNACRAICSPNCGICDPD